MSPRAVLSPEEREAILREARTPRAGDQSRPPVPSRGPLRIPEESAGGPRPQGPRRIPEESAGGPCPEGLGGTRIPIRIPWRTPPSGGGGPVRPPDRGRVFPPRPRRGFPRRRLFFALALVLVILGLAFARIISVVSAVLSPDRSIIAQLADLLWRRGPLLGEKENRVNILLVAVGGEGHAGENLADTVMLLSFRPREGEVALLSIPRDFYVKIPDTELWTRLNAVHAYGENLRRGEGLALLRRAVEDITRQPLHYVARVDFLAFKRVVDEIGGIEITIPHTFYDYWHRINFPAGTEHMNGDRALAYVRARYIEGPEGGDFKRASRTQQVLLAIRKKVLSAQTAVDLRALAGILDALRENVATNFTLSELKRLGDLTRGIPETNIHTAVLSTGAEGLLVGSTEILGGRPASVLRPRSGLGQYDAIGAFVADIFAQAPTTPAPETKPVTASLASPAPLRAPAETVADEQPTVDLRNGTNVVGLAARVARRLEKQQFTIAGVGNAAIRNRTETIVVDRTSGHKPASLRVLLDLLPVATTVKLPAAEALGADANFVVFLGTDVAERFTR